MSEKKFQIEKSLMGEKLQYFKVQKCPVCESEDRKIIYKDLVHTCKVLKKIGIEVQN
jgi:hypothetical protein